MVAKPLTSAASSYDTTSRSALSWEAAQANPSFILLVGSLQYNGLPWPFTFLLALNLLMFTLSMLLRLFAHYFQCPKQRARHLNGAKKRHSTQPIHVAVIGDASFRIVWKGCGVCAHYPDGGDGDCGRGCQSKIVTLSSFLNLVRAACADWGDPCWMGWQALSRVPDPAHFRHVLARPPIQVRELTLTKVQRSCHLGHLHSRGDRQFPLLVHLLEFWHNVRQRRLLVRGIESISFTWGPCRKDAPSQHTK